MKLKIPTVGGICESLQGRDKGRFYIIKEVLQDGTVLVTDGNFKKVSSPKRKNLKHLRLLPQTAESIGNKFLTDQKVFDTEVYSALKGFNCPVPQGEEGGENITENGNSDV